jgi:predicted nucleic acid-binding protein
MIFVDSNIPMYLIGVPGPHKSKVQGLIEGLVASGEPLVTDAEVLQEILYHYMAINRHAAIQPAFDALLGLVGEVFPVDRDTVERAKQIALGHRVLSARDAVHVAVMQQHGVSRILSFDAGFDRFPGITRVL